MNIQELERKLNSLNQPKFRLKQIIHAIFQEGVKSFIDIRNIPLQLREELDKNIQILSFDIDDILNSRKKDSYKAVLRLRDGLYIETVLLSPKLNTWAACISTQVGCALRCNFCATGQSGIKRDLTAEEITDQVLFWKRYMKEKHLKGSLGNIIYMGMGEPFMNWKNVTESLNNLTDKNIFGFGSRSISVSTSGITEKIIEFGKRYPQINLAISLHFADDEKRSLYMPINNKHNLSKLKVAIEQYLEMTNRKIFIEYIMLDGINDNLIEARKLINYIKTFKRNYLLHVNLISYNQAVNNLKPSSSEKIEIFKKYLVDNIVNVTIRKSMGEEIRGACGQLAGK